MKVNYFYTTILGLSLITVSCNEQNENSDKSTANNSSSEVNKDSINEGFSEDVSGDVQMTVQQQWDQIKDFIEKGDKQNLELYLDKNAETFSEENWGYIDFLYPEYFATFNTYNSLSDLPLADYFAPNTYVASVYFETESDGMVFESSVMIYFQEREGKIYIVGCELAG